MNKDSCSRFEKMSTHKLESILRNSLKDLNSSPEEMLLISEILEKRDAGKGIGPPNAEEAWVRFLKRQQGASSGSPPETAPRYHQSRFLQRCAVLAVCFFSVVSLTLTARAFGYDIVGTIVRWTADIFHFEMVSPDGCGYEGTRSWDDVLANGELPTEFIPAWLPEGFEEIAGKQISAAGLYLVYKEYSNGGNALLFNLLQYDSLKSSEKELFEKQAAEVERYAHNGRDFVLARNGSSGYWTAAWTDGRMVFLIQGDVSKSDMVKIIDSLGGISS